jgi:tRNA pseudouridine32 synthase / 23S rRNA pseudouridine746 synthase
VAKRYFAILDGEPKLDSGTIELALSKVSTREEGWRMTGDPKGKPSITRYKVMERKDGKSLVAFYPETGRTHQIRVHAAEGLGVPVMGDPVYGRGGPAMMLHAVELTVPREGKDDIHATAPLPVRFHNAGFGRG